MANYKEVQNVSKQRTLVNIEQVTTPVDYGTYTALYHAGSEKPTSIDGNLDQVAKQLGIGR